MRNAEDSWYLEKLGIQQWVPRSEAEAAQVADTQTVEVTQAQAAPSPFVAAGDVESHVNVIEGAPIQRAPQEAESIDSAGSSTPPAGHGPGDILAKLRAGKQKTKPTTIEPVSVAIEVESPATVDEPVPPPEVVQPPSQAIQASTPATQDEQFIPLGSAADSWPKLIDDWHSTLAQAGLPAANLGEGSAGAAVVVFTELPLDQLTPQQLDAGWRLRAAILSAAGLAPQRCFHAALYSVSSVLQPQELLKRQLLMMPTAKVICFAGERLGADIASAGVDAIMLPSISEMLATPAAKKQAWKTLQPLIESFKAL